MICCGLETNCWINDRKHNKYIKISILVYALKWTENMQLKY